MRAIAQLASRSAKSSPTRSEPPETQSVSADIPNSAFDRPLGERVREFRYRFAQTFIFGAPVLALQWFGPRLGGPEAPRFIAVFQAILSGWILYVAGAGMLFGAWLDAIVALLAVCMYLFGLVCIAPLVLTGHMLNRSPAFHWPVILLLIWTGLRWWQLSRRLKISADL